MSVLVKKTILKRSDLNGMNYILPLGDGISESLDQNRTIPVEELYCKRPIQCLASSEILTLHPLTARRECTARHWCGGRTHSLGGEGVGGSIVWKTPRHCSVLYICKYFVTIPICPLFCFNVHTITGYSIVRQKQNNGARFAPSLVVFSYLSSACENLLRER
jgi:hypothetical protein